MSGADSEIVVGGPGVDESTPPVPSEDPHDVRRRAPTKTPRIKFLCFTRVKVDHASFSCCKSRPAQIRMGPDSATMYRISPIQSLSRAKDHKVLRLRRFPRSEPHR